MDGVGESRLIPLIYHTPFLFESIPIESKFSLLDHPVNISLYALSKEDFELIVPLNQNGTKMDMKMWWDMGTLGAFHDAELGRSFENVFIPMNPTSEFELQFNYQFFNATFGKITFSVNSIILDGKNIVCNLTETNGYCKAHYISEGWPNKIHSLGFLYEYSFNNSLKLDASTFKGKVEMSLKNTVWKPRTNNSALNSPCNVLKSNQIHCPIPFNWATKEALTLVAQQNPFNHKVLQSTPMPIELTIQQPIQRYWLHALIMILPSILLILICFCAEYLLCCYCCPQPYDIEKKRLIN